MKRRDGTVLRADVYRPDISAKVPAIVKRTPYDKSNRGPGLVSPIEAAAAGVAYVGQDVRGQCRSEGEWNAVDWGGLSGPTVTTRSSGWQQSPGVTATSA